MHCCDINRAQNSNFLVLLEFFYTQPKHLHAQRSRQISGVPVISGGNFKEICVRLFLWEKIIKKILSKALLCLSVRPLARQS